MSDMNSADHEQDVLKTEGVDAQDRVSDLDTVTGDEPVVKPGTGDAGSAPGLMQGIDALSGTGDMPGAGDKSRVAPRRISRKDERKASELIAAERAAEEIEVKLTPAEERDIRQAADSLEDAAELRQELVNAKRQQEVVRQVRSRVDRSVPVHQLSSRPSFAVTSAYIEYHTREAYAMLIGRSGYSSVDGRVVTAGDVGSQVDSSADNKKARGRRYHIYGLFEAATKAREVVQGYRVGCPYAAWFLIRIEDEIAKTRALLTEIHAAADVLTSSVTSLKVEPLTARLPAQINLQFHVPYGYHFADLLTGYDNLVRKLKSYAMMQFLTYDEMMPLVNKLSTPLRRLYRLPCEWHFVGRDAVLQKTAPYLAAEHRMGILPEGIVEGILKPQMVRDVG